MKTGVSYKIENRLSCFSRSFVAGYCCLFWTEFIITVATVHVLVDLDPPRIGPPGPNPLADMDPPVHIR